jgi:putative transposase
MAQARRIAFNRWARRGIWKQIFDQVAVRSRVGLYFIDSTVVKAHRCASGGKGGRKIKRSASAEAGERRKSMPLSIAKAVH